MEPTLDQPKLQAISSRTRTRVLKSLKERRKTLSELAAELGFAHSTMSEHLRVLVKAGLIRKVEEGYKWKYYELTLLGKSIGSPEIKWYVLFGISALIITSGFYWIFGYYAATPQYFAETINKATVATAEVMDGEAAASAGALISFQMPPFPYLAIVLIAIGIAGFLATKYFYDKGKKKEIKKRGAEAGRKRRGKHGKAKRT